tara:strand:- start:370 stop:873 length:504 start_codon:yes stop_codon:yes gene_type:complete
MNILLNFGRKTSIMEQEQCCGCNRGCNKEELVSCCEGKLCPECFDYDTNCPNCDKPNKSMHKTVRNKGSMYDLEKNEGNADDKQFGLTPFEQAIRNQDTYLIQGMCDRMLFSSDKKKAMDMAIRSGNPDAIGFLKNSGFPFDYQTPLHLIDEFEYLDQYQARMLLDL